MLDVLYNVFLRVRSLLNPHQLNVIGLKGKPFGLSQKRDVVLVVGHLALDVIKDRRQLGWNDFFFIIALDVVDPVDPDIGVGHLYSHDLTPAYNQLL